MTTVLRTLVGSLGRVYPSKQQACQGLNQFQNFNFTAMVAPLVVRTKKPIKCKLWNNTCCEIPCFLKNYRQEVGDQYIVGPPNLNVVGPVSSGPYGCCAYAPNSCRRVPTSLHERQNVNAALNRRISKQSAQHWRHWVHRFQVPVQSIKSNSPSRPSKSGTVRDGRLPQCCHLLNLTKCMHHPWFCPFPPLCEKHNVIHKTGKSHGHK